MPTLPNMGLVLPTDHGSEDVWDTILDTLFGLVDSHDHTSGKGVQVPAAGLDINADLPFNSGGNYYAATGLKAVDFQPVLNSTTTGYACALFVDSSNNELYWRTAGGVNVKVTDVASLNVSAFTGGIGGDYSSIGALLDYDDASDTYRLRQQSSLGVRQFAKVSTADLKLYEYQAAGVGAVPANAVTVKSPAALASGYTVTLPTALPAAASVVMMSTAGVLSVPQTAVALPTNCNITLAGTGYVQHGDRSTDQVFVPYISSGAPTYSTNMTGGSDLGVILPAGTTNYVRLEGLQKDQRVKSVTVYGAGQLTGGATTATYDVVRQSGLTPAAPVSLLSAPTSSAATSVTLTLSGGGWTTLPYDMLLLKITIPAAVTFGFYSLSVTYDRQ